MVEWDGEDGRDELAVFWLMKYSGQPLHIKGHKVTSITLDDFEMPEDTDAEKE